jgi:hypothetical protein
MGQAISVATVYLVEIATADIRGVTACLLQLFVVVGIMTGYFIAYGSHELLGSMAWTLPFIVQAVWQLFSPWGCCSCLSRHGGSSRPVEAMMPGVS